MHIFLPDFLTINPKTSKPTINLKDNSIQARKNIYTQRDIKQKYYTARTL